MLSKSKVLINFLKIQNRRFKYLFFLALFLILLNFVIYGDFDILVKAIYSFHTNTIESKTILNSFLLIASSLSVLFLCQYFKDFINLFVMLFISVVCYLFIKNITPSEYKSICLFLYAVSGFSTVIYVLIKSKTIRTKSIKSIVYIVEIFVLSYIFSNLKGFTILLHSLLSITVNNFKHIVNPILLFFIIVNLFILNTQTIRGTLFYILRRKELSNRTPISDNILPSVGVIVAAYNEEECILATVKSLFESDYPQEKLNVFVVSDGSTDDTALVLKNHFVMKPIELKKQGHLSTKKILTQYKSENQNLFLIEKENGGKHDALNVGINHMLKDIEWVTIIDADCIIHKQGLRKLVEETFLDPNIVALNGSILGIKHNAFLPTIQELEYTCAFFLNRASLSVLNSMMIVSGAFGMFRKQTLLDLNGYKKGLGEDMTLTLNIQSKKENIIRYVPEAILYTQMPFSFSDLRKQRVRWFKGLIESMLAFKGLLFSPKMFIGYFEFLVVELISPLLFPFGLLVMFGNPQMLTSDIFLFSMGLFILSSLIQNISSIYILKKKTEGTVKPLYMLWQLPFFIFYSIWRNDALLDYSSKEWGDLKRSH